MSLVEMQLWHHTRWVEDGAVPELNPRVSPCLWGLTRARASLCPGGESLNSIPGYPRVYGGSPGQGRACAQVVRKLCSDKTVPAISKCPGIPGSLADSGRLATGGKWGAYSLAALLNR